MKQFQLTYKGYKLSLFFRPIFKYQLQLIEALKGISSTYIEFKMNLHFELQIFPCNIQRFFPIGALWEGAANYKKRFKLQRLIQGRWESVGYLLKECLFFSLHMFTRLFITNNFFFFLSLVHSTFSISSILVRFLAVFSLYH